MVQDPENLKGIDLGKHHLSAMCTGAHECQVLTGQPMLCQRYQHLPQAFIHEDDSLTSETSTYCSAMKSLGCEVTADTAMPNFHG